MRLNITTGRKPRFFSREPGVWITAAGTRVQIGEMERSHLRATVYMLCHNVFAMKMQLISELPRLKKKIFNMSDMGFLAEYVPTWEGLVEECIKRKVRFYSNEF